MMCREVSVLHAAVVLSLFVACSTGAPEPDAVARLEGSWTVEPSVEDRRQATLLRLALRDPPPSEADLSQSDLTPSEAAMVRSVLSARRTDPPPPQLAELRDRLSGLESATLEITTNELRFTLGEATSTRRYTVLSAEPERVEVSVVHPSGQSEEDAFVFRGPDEVALVEPDGKETLLRRHPDGG
ncbi:MAG: hypothetical protein ACI8S6_000777 [Myxococcota bacterium]|jgi:hypothetical protein